MEVISPLSLLEVTMNEAINDDCIVIDDDDDVATHNRQCNVNKMEVEVDPLFVGPSVVYNDKQNDMPTLWVTTNITNLAGVLHAETAYRKNHYTNINEVLTEILHCTICCEHVGCDIRIHPSSIEHPVLKVLICQRCVCIYKSVNFIMNEKGKEINCRWCGKKSSKDSVLRTCQQCPFSFCERCLKNNCPDYFAREPRFPWTCVVCNMRVLWPARATLWALNCLKSLLLDYPGNSLAKINGDISLCCKNRKKNKKAVVNALQNSGTSNNFDLDQLVPPHLLNGSTEVDGYHSQLPEIGFSNSIDSYPNNQKQRVKSRAKPRPKSKMKPKPKPKASAASSPSVSVPANMSSNVNDKTPTKATSDKKPHWLRQKLIGYINDFNQLRTKLEEIENSIDFDENDPQTEEKVDSITTLLALHRELLNSCRLSLINEWKERKTRLVLEKYNPNADGVTEIINVASPTEVIQEKVLRTRLSTPNNRNNYNTIKISGLKYVNLDEKTYAPIKDCFVKLNRLDTPLDFFVKQEKKSIK